MFKKSISFMLLTFLISNFLQAQTRFERGTQEVGLTNLGISYSDVYGTSVSASSRYQYFLLNRFALGAFVFYNNFNDDEWMGLGPVGSYILFTHSQVFSRIDQQVTAAKFNGFEDNHSTFYGTSILSLNYMPEGSNAYFGGGYGLNYSLNSQDVYSPNFVQFFLGWLF